MPNKKKSTTTGKSKLRSLFILVILLLAVGACSIAAWTMYEMKNMQARMLSDSEPPEETEVTEPITPVYVPLDTFTVSLKPAGEEYDRVLYIGLTLRVNNEDDKSKIEKYLPEVRSRLLMLFSGHSAEELSLNEGKSQLIQDIKQVLTTPLDEKSGVVVTDVLFNAFILR
ncbi:flagellar basal body-associated protein FliL [Mixta theicola]|uniref:Flagellar protein FliL n=1 Tax=Mixta theicola TaxID=1458355 RepID=A0A2K1Q813_9GAMM|nr:flagellar basal body-associated protein FliL [Mixta theicola]PNS11182.1 flagellar basal body-associated protein FliL [Mixta theicola]GLR07555.1 flagellar basal body protein FliL [Mixta theicola]